MSNIPANGGHGRRIVEDYIERSSLSQVPVAKAFLRMPKQTPLRLGRKVQLGGGHTGRGMLAGSVIGGTAGLIGGSIKNRNKAPGIARQKAVDRDVHNSDRRQKRANAAARGPVPKGYASHADLDRDMRELNRMERATAHGKVYSEKEMHAAPGPHSRSQLAKSLFGKSQRYYDPEHRRQRRFGVGMAATGLAGAGMAVAGGRGLRAANKVAPKVVAAAKPAAKKAAAKPPVKPRQAPPKYYKGTGRDLAMVGGGSTLMAGSAGLAYHGNHTRGKAWT